MQDFSSFLKAKIALDDRSLNRVVWQQLVYLADEKSSLDVLDVGTGTGAMLCRLLKGDFSASLSLNGLDCDASLLTKAHGDLRRLLTGKGYQLKSSTQSALVAERGGQRISFTAEACAIEEYHPAKGVYQLITAHAVMDLLPLTDTVALFYDWLKPGGWFYSSINYDGETVLFPCYEDLSFEQQLLDTYDASMERRRTVSRHTGGAFCGRRLFQALLKGGFEIIAYGSSDWNITPINGRYRGQDELVIRCLLDWIFAEGRDCPAVDVKSLKQWFHSRTRQLENSELGIIIHQMDILARRI